MATIASTSASDVSWTSEQHTATAVATDSTSMNASYETATLMNNATDVSDTFFPVTTERSGLFGDVSRAEEVIIWASISVGVLATIAVILRLVMPLIRKKYRQLRQASKLNNKHGSSSQLLETAFPLSSASIASTSTASSQLEFWKADDSQASVTTISEGVSSRPKHSAFGSLSPEVMSTPVYLPKLKLISLQVDTSSQERLNKELTSVLSTPVLQRLTSLNLNADYRENWNKSTQENSTPSDSSGQSTQLAESEGLCVPALIHHSSPELKDWSMRAPVLIHQSSSRLKERGEDKDKKILTRF